METTEVCDRCGSEACVGKDKCAYDGLAHGTAQVPSYKLARQKAVEVKAKRTNLAEARGAR